VFLAKNKLKELNSVALSSFFLGNIHGIKVTFSLSPPEKQETNKWYPGNNIKPSI